MPQDLTSSPVQPIRILIVDDQVLIREALVGLIDTQPDLRVVGQAASLQEALALVYRLRPDVVVIEFTLPDGTGAEATRQILARRPDSRVVILTSDDEDGNLYSAMSAGAVGYLLKDITATHLFSRLRCVMQGEVAFSPGVGQRVLARIAHREAQPSPPLAAAEQLTEREAAILRLLVEGYTNRQIADQLMLSIRTIEYHRAKLTSKLGSQSRAALIHYATERGLSRAVGEGHSPVTI